jgi:hypothetical protein
LPPENSEPNIADVSDALAPGRRSPHWTIRPEFDGKERPEHEPRALDHADFEVMTERRSIDSFPIHLKKIFSRAFAG